MKRDTVAGERALNETSRVREIVIEALQWKRRCPRANGYPYLNQIAGVLGVTQADIEEDSDGRE